MFVKILAIFFLFTFDVVLSEDNKRYKKDFNEIPSMHRFRSSKVKQLWDKANRIGLPEVTLSELFVELKHQDNEWMRLKQLKHSNKDQDGLVEAKLQKEFNDIIIKYGFDEKTKTENFVRNGDKRQRKPFFQDPKLDKLWHAAMSSSKFSPDEMEKLRTEFEHHQDKLFEYKNLKDAVTRLSEVSDNSIDKMEAVKEMKRENRKLESMEEEVKDNYERLALITRKLRGGRDGGEEMPFVEPRVAELWDIATKGNFSETELASIEDELKHFQSRIDKHRHYRDELKNSAEKIDYHGGKEHAPTERISKHQKLQDKVNDLAYKVQKLFNNMKVRFSRGVFRHNEL